MIGIELKNSVSLSLLKKFDINTIIIIRIYLNKDFILINQTKEQTIRKILSKYETEPSHALQVAKLALIIFDKTKDIIHNMSGKERYFLEIAALLHDIGYYISAKGHHKNSFKIIEQEKFSGFSDLEKLIIGNIARYHRGNLPDEKHSGYARLSKSDKGIVNKLSAFLRLADAFDRSHRSIVDDIDFVYDSFSSNLIILLKLNVLNGSFELIKANDKKDLFEKEFKLELSFRIIENQKMENVSYSGF